MTYNLSNGRSELLAPNCLLPARDVIADDNLIPKLAGIYAWWFRDAPSKIPQIGTDSRDGYHLLYVGIAPRRPSRAGIESRSNLRKRILKCHLGGQIGNSTLRLSLAALLTEEQNFSISRRPSGKRQMSKSDETKLTDWLSSNAALSFMTCNAPWEIEKDLLTSDLALPLNIAGSKHSFRTTLTRMRSQCAIA